MKTGLSLNELAAKITSQSEAKNDYIADTRQLQVIGDQLVVENEGAFDLTNHAQGQIATYTGIPRRYYDRMRADAPALLTRNVEEWFQREPKRRMVRTMETNARAFLSEKYRALDNEELAEAVLPVLFEKDVDVISSEITDTRMYIKVVDRKLRGRVDWGEGHNFGRAADDEIIWGAVISNSEVGAGSLQVSTMTLSSWCSNLMVVGKEFRKYHVGRAVDVTGEYYRDETRIADDRATVLKLRDTVDHALTEVAMQDTLDKYSLAAGRKIETDPVKAVEKVSKILRVSDEEQGSILRHLVEGGSLNQWSLANAVTRTAEDSKTYDRATELEALGMNVVDLTASQWKVVAA